MGVNITVKSIPEGLATSLRQAAASAQRSLNGEIIHRLRQSFSRDDSGPADSCVVAETPDEVADAWLRLGGKWKSATSVEDEIAALYETRSPGRVVDPIW